MQLGAYRVSDAHAADYEWFIEHKHTLMEAYSELAVMMSRAQELLTLTGQNEPGVLAKDVFRAWDAFWAAYASADPSRVSEALVRLQTTMERARGVSASYEELWGLFDLIRKVRATEIRRQTVIAEIMTGDQARFFGAAVNATVEKVLADFVPVEQQQAARSFYKGEMARIQATRIVG